jgi:4-amino-4-deoxy-L-arabinose transferase-like glycosyltransferase
VATVGQDRRTLWACLGLILVLAAILRIWGMGYGLPHPTARPDEELVVGKAFGIVTTGRLDPGNYTYPSLLIYLQALALAAYARAAAVVGRYPQPHDFLFAVAVTRPGLQYVIARAVSVGLGTATAVVSYQLASSAYRRRDVGLLAALAVATNYLHVRDSRFATVDVAMTFFATVSLVFAVRAAESQRCAHYVLAGLFAGLAASAKYNGAIVFLSVVAAAVVPWARSRFAPTETRVLLRNLLIAGALLAVAFAVTSPYVVLRHTAVLEELAARRRYVYDTGGERALWVHLRETFPVGFGWPLFFAAGWALLRAARLRRPADLVLLAFVVPMFALTAGAGRVFPRYVVPFVPALAVMGAETVVAALPGRFRSTGLTLASLAIAGPGLWHSIAFDRLASREDTRVLAAEWVGAHLPPRSTIAICSGYAAPVINDDHRRPPAFRPSTIDCAKEPTPIGDAGYLITAEHPFLTRWSRIPPSLRRSLERGARPLAVFDPFRERATEKPYFYPGDAFYLPFSGLGAVERGGPVITVWALSLDPHDELHVLGESRREEP